jgi:hypothetical protein
MGLRELNRVRKIALALPGVEERESHGARCFFVGPRLALCYFHDDHRGDGRISLWCRGPTVLQDALLGFDPERFFKPTTSAGGAFRGWMGVFLDTRSDGRVDWREISAILEDAFRNAAPRRLVAQLDDR